MTWPTDYLNQVICGDCLEVLKTLPENSIDSIVTDPPYGLSFMGKHWDYDVPAVDVWRECLRVLKPGGHLLSFAGTRTYHRMAVNIEDAGFEIRDMIAWVYGSGFPKSLDVSKAIDKMAGASREIIGNKIRPDGKAVIDARPNGFDGCHSGYDRPWKHDRAKVELQASITAPATEPAKQWQGWGTALKPALEPICVARKPLIGTVAENVLQYGTGGINVDGCRLDAPWRKTGTVNPEAQNGSGNCYLGSDGKKQMEYDLQNLGRFPANLIHDGSEEVLAGFPESISTGGCGAASKNWKGPKNQFMANIASATGGFGDSGSAARFFYCAKASKEDRDEGLDNTRIVKYNIPKGVLSCEESMALVESLQRVMSVDGLDAKWLTGENGASIMGLCRLDSLSTTLTAISKITPLKILNSLQPKITRESTVDANCEMENGGNLAVSAEKSSRLNQVITSVSLELAPGASLAVSQMLSTISAAANWKPLTNFHSTVKPTDLMRYLCRLVTPPNGLILDPFFGGGSTGKAAKLEYFNYIGIEREPEYCEIARKRIDGTLVNRKLNFQEARS